MNSVHDFFIRRGWGTSVPALIFCWTILSVVVLSPYLFLDRLIAPGADAIAYYYPAMYWYAKALSSGESFLWDPQIFSGFPSYLSQVSGYIEPVNWLLFSVFPFLFAYHVRLVIDFVLVMLFTYLVARRWGISMMPAFFAGPMYLLAFHWWYLSNTVIANSLFLMPFLLWAFLSALDASQWWRRALWGIAGGAGVGWVFLAGYAQIVVYAVFLVGVYAVYDFFAKRDLSVRRGFQYAGILTLFVIVGGLIGAPQILASMAYVPVSVRGGGLDYTLTQTKVLEPQEIIFLIFPDYLRFPLLNGGKKPIFIGALFLATAVIALLHPRRSRNIAIMLALLLLTILLAIPGSPLYYAMHQLPVFDMFRYPYRWLYLGAWFFVMLGAFGWDMLRDEVSDKRSKAVAVGLAVVAVGVSFFTILCSFAGEWFWSPVKGALAWLFATAVYSSADFDKDLSHYEAALARAVDAWRDVASLTNAPYAVPASLLVVAAFLVLARVYGYMSFDRFRVSAAMFCVATFLGIFIARWPDSLPSSVLSEHDRTAGTTILPDDMLQYRVHPFNLSETFASRVPLTLAWDTENVLAGVELQFASGGPNDHRFSGHNLTDGYDPFVARDLREVLAHLGGNYAAEDLVSGVSLPERKRRLTENLDVLSMMSGKYVIAGGVLDHPSLRLLAAPEASRYRIPYYIYENMEVQPRIRIARDIAEVEHATVMELIHAGHKFDTTYLDCAGCAADGPGDGEVDILETGNGHFIFRVRSIGSSWLVVSEQLLPGWQAELDGESVEPVRANGMYMAFKIPPGEHRLELQYEGILGEARWLYPLGLFPRAPLSW